MTGWKAALVASLFVAGLAWAQSSNQPSSAGQGEAQAQADSSSSVSAGPQVPPEDERTIQKSSRIRRALKRAAPDCIKVWGSSECKSSSGESGQAPAKGAPEADDSAKDESSGPSQAASPLQNAPIPRSGSDDSSSKQTKIDLGSMPGGEGAGVQEMHPWDPHRAEKDIEVGDFYYKRGNYKAAISRYREALQFKPKDAVATYKLAEALEKDGNLNEARENYAAYLKILPNGDFAEQANKALERLNRQLQAAAPAK